VVHRGPPDGSPNKTAFAAHRFVLCEPWKHAPLNPLLLLLVVRREHVDVLHQARPRAAIGAGAVRQRLMPDDEIAGAPADGARA
jgi:hypothetical protein